MSIRALTLIAAAVAVSIPAGASANVVFATLSGGTAPIRVANDDGTGARTIARGLGPVVSPDGGKVAYLLNSGGVSDQKPVRVIGVATGTVATVVGRCMPGSLMWSPDSTRILCRTEAVTARGVVTGNGLAIIGPVPAQLVATPAIPYGVLIAAKRHVMGEFGWSPDSTRIVIATGPFSMTGVGMDVYVADPAAMSAKARIMSRANYPVWGAAGIAVARFRNVYVRVGGSRTPMTHSQVWIVQPDGSGARQVTRYTATGLTMGPQAALWTPSGADLIGSLVGEDVSQLVRIDVASGRPVRISPQWSLVTPVAVSADGSRILSVTSFDTAARGIGIGNRLESTTTAGTDRRVIARNVTDASVSADWAP